MAQQPSSRTVAPDQRLLDEIEQLRTSLEGALEENTRLTEDRDRLLRRVTTLSREMQAMRHNALAATVASTPELAEQAQQSEAEEALRVAFEELQVLTEELEVANTSLHEANEELDARVEQRTRQIQEVNGALRATESSLRTIADLVPDVLWRTDAGGAADWFNQRWFGVTGDTAEAPLGEGWGDAIHPVDRIQSRDAWRAAMETGTPFEAEQRLREANGNYRWFLIRAEPMREEEGEIVAWFAAGTDIHERRTAMEALERSERRFRTLIEGMPQLVWRAVDGGQWTWSSPQWSDYTGQAEADSHAQGWLAMYHPKDREAAVAAWKRAYDIGQLEIEGRIFHAAEARHRHFRTRALPVRDEAGRVIEWLGTSTDIDDMHQLQDRQSVLVAELQHRTRNLMAVVQAVTMRTIKGVGSLAEFRACIDDRLQALARVQGLLSRREGNLRVPFDLLLREELSAHTELDADGNGQQISMRGPRDVALWSSIVQTLALALHELATNAVKYGALSQPGAHLHVEWGLADAAAGKRRLRIDWRESGVAGPPDPSARPRGGGYGRELIERALPYQLGARTSYGFEADGVHCTIEMEVPGEDGPTEMAHG